MAAEARLLPWERVPDHLRELRDRVRRFVDEAVIPREQELEAAGFDPTGPMPELQAMAREQGLWALGLPPDIGGGGLSFLDYTYVNEVIGRSYHALSALGTHIIQDALLIHQFGTPEQRRRWVEPMVAGTLIPCFAVTEPDVAGSDPTLIRTAARRDGDGWVITGRKWAITHANVAGVATVMAVTDPDAPPHRRASLFLVPVDTPGFSCARVIPMLGDTVGGHCEVVLDEVRVDDAAMLGERGAAFAMAQSRLAQGRVYHAMRWLGQMERALELLCARASTRFSHGSVLADKQIVQEWIADSAAAITATRLMTLDAARIIDEGGDARLAISLLKFAGAEALSAVVDRAVQVHGSLGVSADSPLDMMYRRARFARLYDGPDEVHRVSAARRILAVLGSAS